MEIKENIPTNTLIKQAKVQHELGNFQTASTLFNLAISVNEEEEWVQRHNGHFSNILQAVKKRREDTGCSLKEAKLFCDEHRIALGITNSN